MLPFVFWQRCLFLADLNFETSQIVFPANLAINNFKSISILRVCTCSAVTYMSSLAHSLTIMSATSKQDFAKFQILQQKFCCSSSGSLSRLTDSHSGTHHGMTNYTACALHAAVASISRFLHHCIQHMQPWQVSVVLCILAGVYRRGSGGSWGLHE